METIMTQDCGCATKTTDHYTSFEGIDCNGNARRIMEMIDRHLAIPGRSNVFWEYFAKKRAGKLGLKQDDLLLIHSSIQQVRELFETWDDAEALRLLDQLENECC
jgi:hypothetical protein